MKLLGLVRVEVMVRKKYAGLVRDVAAALGGPERTARTRRLFQPRISPSARRGLKELLAEAPLEGSEIEQSRDYEREVKP